VSITISADDPRTIRAIELAAEADQWLSGRNRGGEDVYAVPSQSESGRYYIVTSSSCDCPDFRHNGPAAETASAASEQRPCKHILAVRLHSELVRAQQRVNRRDRGHLSVVRRVEQ
jgi:hypothetical protein